MNEIWKDIEGYKGLYQISNLGQVKSLNYSNTREIKKLSLCKQSNGYLVCLLYRNGNRKTYKIHRLVAQTFLSNPNNYPVINHKDEDKTNNCVDNLEWCSISYNNAYGTHREKVGNAHKKEVYQYLLDGTFIKKWGSVRECAKYYNISEGNIASCCRKKIKTCGGYKFSYTTKN
jgi:hypothetical protein